MGAVRYLGQAEAVVEQGLLRMAEAEVLGVPMPQEVGQQVIPGMVMLEPLVVTAVAMVEPVEQDKVMAEMAVRPEAVAEVKATQPQALVVEMAQMVPSESLVGR